MFKMLYRVSRAVAQRNFGDLVFEFGLPAETIKNLARLKAFPHRGLSPLFFENCEKESNMK